MKRVRKLKRILWPLSLAFFGIVVFLAVVIFFLSRDLPPVDQLAANQIVESTKIYDREGRVVLYEANAGQRRTVIPFEEIPQSVKDATVIAEDDNFYNEPAFDVTAIFRALLADLKNGRFVQGGSTLTQQLAKNAFLSRERTITRKIKELLLAIQLNRHYSKDQILGFYLNDVPYGLDAYGIESAAQLYFGKSAKNLILPESALLAAILQAPSYYSPWGSHVQELLAHEQFVLSKMYAKGKISKEQLTTALATKLVFQPAHSNMLAPHFVLAVEEYLINTYGEDTVREGGLRVISTLDWKLQQIAQKAVKDGADRNEALYKGKNAALVAEDATTGQVLAMVGSRDYFDLQNEGNFNVATQGLRQPGSALKPFVYMTGFEKGFTPDSILFDVPIEFGTDHDKCPPVPNYTLPQNSACFHPQDFSGTFEGPVHIRQALARSLNIPAVQMLYLAGVQDSLTTLRNFGITTLTDPRRYGLSLVLGGGEVHLIDLVGAYATLAQEGTHHEQSMVLEVQDHEGTVLETFKDKVETVVPPQYPRLINNILSDADARAPLYQNSLSLTVFPDHDVALKTGTSNDFRDAWSMGYTPSFVVGVWAGNNDNKPMQKRGSSVLAAVPIWHDFMAQALEEQSSTEAFTKPDPVTSQKPVLRGEVVVDNQIHSILYYVNKNDPTGPAPANPAADPQFPNWEIGVLTWAKNNIQNFSSYNQPPSPLTVTSGPPDVTITSPSNGAFVNTQIPITGTITASKNLAHITIYFNNQLVGDITEGLGVSYALHWLLNAATLLPQNTVRVEATDVASTKSVASVIVYQETN